MGLWLRSWLGCWLGLGFALGMPWLGMAATEGGDRNPIWQGLTLERLTVPPAPEAIRLEPSRFFPGQAGAIGEFSVVDRRPGATHAVTLANGAGDTDNGKFAISGRSLLPWLFDFGSVPPGTAFSVRVRATDLGEPGRWLEQVMTVAVEVPRAPMAVRLDAGSVSLRAGAGALVARVRVEDPDLFDRHRIERVAGAGDADNGMVEVVGDEVRLVRGPGAGQGRLRFRLGVTDAAGLVREQAFDLAFEAPRLNLNEILTGELGGVLDQNRGRKEWIELHNGRAQYEELEGWFLTDDPDDLARWRFPARRVGPGAFVVILADGLGVAPTGSTNLHAGFSLRGEGEWIGLVGPAGAGAGVVSGWEFPAQYPGVSYGVGSDGRLGHLGVPTPGAANGVAAEAGENGVGFSRGHGFYTNAFDLELSATLAGSTIRYTLDGSAPTATTGMVYSGPVRVSPSTVAATRGTRVVRALAVHPGAAYARVTTQTYLFVNGVAGPSVDGVVGQSRLASSITRHAVYGPLLDDALLALPALSVTLAGGLSTVERVASLELFDPAGGEAGFQVDCGIQVTGTTSLASPKLSMAARFRAAYGRSKLQYPVFARGSRFPGRAAVEFNELRLRSHSHDTFHWLGTRENPPVPYGSPAVMRSGDAQLLRNPWIDEMQLAMGQPGKRGRQVHLYLNGSYHGIYHIHEHADEDYMASYYPGGREEYHFSGGATTGSDHGGGDTWRGPWGNLKGSLGNYAQAMRWIDMTNLCDSMVLSFYAGNDWDWSTRHNWSAAGPRLPDRSGWKFFQQDSDITLQDVAADCTDQDAPDGIFTALMRFPEFRVLFRDRVYRHCFGNGVLTPERAAAFYEWRAEEISTAIVAETARWQPSSSVGTLPWDRDEEWANERRYLRETFFPQRTARLLQQIRRRSGWWTVEPPVADAVSGTVPVGTRLSFQAPVGTVYYTVDGSDPRLTGGGIRPGARSMGSGGGTVRTLIPAGSVWRFLDTGTEPGVGWAAAGFDDGGWKSGPAEIGYGDGNERTVSGHVDTDPVSPGVQKNLTTYFRRVFDVADLPGLTGLRFRMVRDDGAVVYLNGREVWRVNMPEGPIVRTTPASTGVGGEDESAFVEQTLEASQVGLSPTGNVLAVEIHQQSSDSSDISFDFELIGMGAGVPSVGGLVVDRPMTVRARTFSGTDWSAVVDLHFVPEGTRAASASNLTLSEVQYNPLDSPDAEFVEFLNISGAAVDLSGVVMTNAVYFPFPPATVLGAGERLVVVKDPVVFGARYGAVESPYRREGVRVLGPWVGSLSNDGERIDVLGAEGGGLFSMGYETGRGWPSRADGRGSSLELMDPAGAPRSTGEVMTGWLGRGSNWRASVEFHGSPGVAGAAPEGRVVLNEVLSAPPAGETDAIELFNRGGAAVDLSGWFLSDAASEYRKFRVPGGLILGPGGRVVFREPDFNRVGAAGSLIPFGLSEAGDDVYLVEADATGNLLRFADVVSFGALPRGVSLGRSPDGVGPWVWLGEPSLGSENGIARSGYDAWAAVAFPGDVPAADRGPDADPDGDGHSNLAEYAFVLSPVRAEGGPLWVVGGSEPGGLVFGYRVRTGGAGIGYRIEVSDDLRAWSGAGPVEEVSRVPLADGATEVTARLRARGAGVFFVRVGVEWM